MKNYKFTIRGNEYDVDIQEIEDNVAKIEVNGSTYQVEIHREKAQSKTPKLVRPKVVPSSEAAIAKTRKPTASKGAGSIKAPLPGTVLEIKTSVGAEVKTGDTLLIMEAMKMELELKAERAATIKQVLHQSSEQVKAEAILVELEPI